MSDLFNYSCLQTSLNTNLKNLKITIKDFDTNKINEDFIFELNSVAQWASVHTEINSILITAEGDLFSQGVDELSLLSMSHSEIQIFYKKFKSLIRSMFYLPQTIVMDLKNGFYNMGLELSLPADIRIAHIDIEAHIDYLKFGIVPAAGGISLLSKFISPSLVKKWILNESVLTSNELTNCGYVANTYTDENKDQIINQILERINNQSPTGRLQTKGSFFEGVRNELEDLINRDFKYSMASMISEDYKEAINSFYSNRPPHFKSLKDVKRKIQTSIQKAH